MSVVDFLHPLVYRVRWAATAVYLAPPMYLQYYFSSTRGRDAMPM